MSAPSLPFWSARLGACALLFLAGCGGLPESSGRVASTALKSTGRTALAARVQPKLAAHPGLTGLHALADAHDALAARLALADAAQRSLDVQYFIWNRDLTGKVMTERLFRAADRGVRVRVLLDDLGTMPTDEVLLAINSHPNIEVRMFNPVAWRSLRMLGIAADFARVNKRMHNKSFIADGQVAIVGGRNIGDEYFGANPAANFADLDVAVIGPAVKEVADDFDLYWNHPAAVPITSLARQTTKPEQMAAMRARLVAHHSTVEASEYGEKVSGSEFTRELHQGNLTYYWGRASIVEDHPDKVLTSSSKRDTHLGPQLTKVLDATKRELFLVSPYFVPGQQGLALLEAARRRGLRVVVLTNSLASTDGIPVHSGYQRYRKPLVEAGVELYEIKPTGAEHPGRGGSVRGFSGAGGSSGASLHAKTFAFDRRIGFIGSYNLDPRSSRLNTEMGVLFDCPALAKQLPETVERDLDRTAYRIGLENHRLVWITHENGREVRYYSEPEATLWKRTKATVISWLPIEWLL